MAGEDVDAEDCFGSCRERKREEGKDGEEVWRLHGELRMQEKAAVGSIDCGLTVPTSRLLSLNVGEGGVPWIDMYSYSYLAFPYRIAPASAVSAPRRVPESGHLPHLLSAPTDR